MVTVGNKLREIALGAKDERELDVFGRTAFNRYYYASFLIAREMLAKMDTSWAIISHRSIPELLSGKVLRRIRDTAKSLARRNVISMNEQNDLCWLAASSVTELGRVLKIGYAARIIADYQPDKRVVSQGRVLRLEGRSLDEAQRWPARASRYSGSLLKVWKQLGL